MAGVVARMALAVLVGWARSAGAAEGDLADRRLEVDKLIRSAGDVELRRQAAAVYSLVDVALAEGDDQTAARYLQRMLRSDPWNLDYQLTYGEIMARRGHSETLALKARQVRKLAERESTIVRACVLAGQPLPAAPAALAYDEGKTDELVLLQVDETNLFVLEDLRAALAARLRMPVRLARLQVGFGPPDRTAWSEFVARARPELSRQLDADPAARRWLEDHGIAEKEWLSDDRAFARAMRILVRRSGGEKEVRLLDEKFAALDGAGEQWSSDRLLGEVDLGLAAFKRPRRWFVAVTQRDLYSRGANFLFGAAQNGGTVALISARRFGADFTHEVPSRPRLTQRLVKQALSSFGFMLGIPRCANPDCARAFPEDLGEHDAKPDTLCDECQAEFARRL